MFVCVSLNLVTCVFFILLVRWSLALQEHNLEIHDIPESENVVADALSRCICLNMLKFLCEGNTKFYNLNLFIVDLCI